MLSRLCFVSRTLRVCVAFLLQVTEVAKLVEMPCLCCNTLRVHGPVCFDQTHDLPMWVCASWNTVARQGCGVQVTGFSDTEEAAVGATEAVPFSLEAKLQAKGGTFSKGGDWQPHAVQGGYLITGQNPQSSEAVAELMIKALAV